MRPSSRFKVTIGISLLVILIIGLTFLWLHESNHTCSWYISQALYEIRRGRCYSTSDLRSLERHSQPNLYWNGFQLL